MKKILIIYILTLLIWGCKKEGEQVVLTGFEAPILSTTVTNAVLEEQQAANLALQFVWASSQLNSTKSIAQSAVKNTLELSVDPTFATIGRRVEGDALAVSYTHDQINKVVLAMGFEPAVPKKLYARVSSKLANNLDVLISNTVEVTIQAYQPSDNADYLFMSNRDMTQFPWKLCSRNKDGFYDGFVKVDQWYNFYLLDEPSAQASKIYGSAPKDGGQYTLHSGDDRWGCWTNNGGYLYISADMNKMEWKETVINSLAVTGDFNGWNDKATLMVYDSEAKVWKTTITTSAPEQWGMKILINGSWTWFFGASENDGECTLNSADASGFKYDKVGTHVLSLDLSDPKAFKYSID